MLPIDCPACKGYEWSYERGHGYTCTCGYFIADYQIIIIARGNPDGPPDVPTESQAYSVLDTLRKTIRAA